MEAKYYGFERRTIFSTEGSFGYLKAELSLSGSWSESSPSKIVDLDAPQVGQKWLRTGEEMPKAKMASVEPTVRLQGYGTALIALVARKRSFDSTLRKLSVHPRYC